MTDHHKINKGSRVSVGTSREKPKDGMPKKLSFKMPKPELLVMGWIEHIDLPDIDLHDIRTKIDTGARTSALHATEIEQFTRDNKQWVRFHVQLVEAEPGIDVEAPVYDIRHIKNTGGLPEERVVIRTTFRIADRAWPISVSLTDRASMKFPMIVGRSALKRQNFAVHTRKANLLSLSKR